ncbi:MAG: LysR family transcriptional regulator [Rhodobacteraceae bacterium]|nr:LysR family transcriptional regulator [Paracoccaceae bacterium]
MHSAALRYFVAVAEAGSIRGASETLHIASSAVSRQIQKLEHELGAQLFERLSGGLQLTREGEVTLEHAHTVFEDFEQLKAKISSIHGTNTGTVRIASLDSLFVGFLPEQVRVFHEHNPEVSFRIQGGGHGRVAQLVADGDADIGIAFNLHLPNGAEVVTDIAMPMMAMVASHHPLAVRRSITLSECAEHDLLLHFDNEPIRSLIEVELSFLDRAGRTLIASNNLLALRSMIVSGAGVAFFTPIGFRDEIRKGSIVGIPLQRTSLRGLRLGLLVAKKRRQLPAVRAMVRQLSDAFRDLGADCSNQGGRRHARN